LLRTRLRFGEGRESETEQQRSKKKTMKTNKQNKTNSKNNSELQNRTEQLPPAETETAKTPEKALETVTQNAPVKPYVNFTEREFNRSLPVEKVLEKLRRWMPAQYGLAEVVGNGSGLPSPNHPPSASAPSLASLASTGTTPANAGSIRAERPSHAERRSPARSTPSIHRPKPPPHNPL
jgi:hypothetical protein